MRMRRTPPEPRRVAPVAVAATLGPSLGGPPAEGRPGYDLATGWGSPLANTVAGLLGARG